MNFLFFLLAIALVVLKVMGTIKISWVAVGLIALGLLLLPQILNGSLFGTLFRTTNSNTNDPLQTDACGCGPAQVVALSRRNFWGNWKGAGTAPCNVALSRVNGSSRYRMDGCVN